LAWVQTENPAKARRHKDTIDAVQKLRSEFEESGKIKRTRKKKAMDYSEAVRREKAAKALEAELKLAELEKSLVRKDVVYRQLFDAGQMLRDAILGVPARIKRDVIAAGNDEFEVERIITDELTNALRALTDTYALNL